LAILFCASFTAKFGDVDTETEVEVETPAEVEGFRIPSFVIAARGIFVDRSTNRFLTMVLADDAVEFG
jgi:hypothetical protein